MPPVYAIVLSKRTLNDIDAIAAYVARDAPERAARLVEGLRAAISRLARLPSRHRVVFPAGKTRPDTRMVPAGMYLIYYRVDDVKRVVPIVTVRDGRRRPLRRL